MFVYFSVGTKVVFFLEVDVVVVVVVDVVVVVFVLLFVGSL